MVKINSRTQGQITRTREKPGESTGTKGKQLSGLTSEVIINVISLDMMTIMKQGLIA